MKTFACMAALALSAAAVPASAATIVQTDNELLLRGFNPFNPALGTLNSVTVQIDLWRPRAWLMVMESAGPTSATVDWAVNGSWRLPGSDATGGVDLFVPLTGSGTADVSLDFAEDGLAAGVFGVYGRGNATVTLNLAAFLGDRVTFNGFDPGYHWDMGDTSLGSGAPATFLHLANGCPGGAPDDALEDYCGSTSYTLTYDYTPGVAAVPEPGTWAMMLVGFAGAGMALRRARRRVPAAA